MAYAIKLACLTLTSLLIMAIFASANNAYAQQQPCNCVAFRLDDVQDYYKRQEQMAIIELFRSSNATLTVGVIGNAFGEDKILVDYLKNSSNIEIANHGWNHEMVTQFTMEQQSRLIGQTNDRIYSTLGVKPVTFIAPYNTFNNDTIDAMKENGLSIISAHFFAGSPKMPDDKGVYHLPTNANVSDWEGPGGQWYSTPTDQTMRDILRAVQEHGYSVVMLHPHDYDNAAEIEKLIDRVRASNLRIVTISEIAGIIYVPEFISPVMPLLVVMGMVMSVAIFARSRKL